MKMKITKEQLKEKFDDATKEVTLMQKTMAYQDRIKDDIYNAKVVYADKCARYWAQVQKYSMKEVEW